MKRFLILVAASVLVLFGSSEAAAQSRFGVIGGMSFSRASEMNRATMTQWHAGLTYKLSLPVGFSFQPALIYHNKGSKTTDMKTIQTSYIELPVSIQWGPDLIVCRPFLDVTPFIGYAVGNKMWVDGQKVDVHERWNSMRRFEYGLGVGVGLEIWRFQVIGRYMWNFGTLADRRPGSTFVGTYISNAFSKGSYRGFVLSVAFLFGGGRR